MKLMIKLPRLKKKKTLKTPNFNVIKERPSPQGIDYIHSLLKNHLTKQISRNHPVSDEFFSGVKLSRGDKQEMHRKWVIRARKPLNERARIDEIVNFFDRLNKRVDKISTQDYAKFKKLLSEKGLKGKNDSSYIYFPFSKGSRTHFILAYEPKARNGKRLVAYFINRKSDIVASSVFYQANLPNLKGRIIEGEVSQRKEAIKKNDFLFQYPIESVMSLEAIEEIKRKKLEEKQLRDIMGE
ncbi:MAG: hypothetical protein JW703_05555 [Candidatus Diapherotrites archaeon]|nr:hypothetical protein [Candidatus Diapherotrites archaeon]